MTNSIGGNASTAARANSLLGNATSMLGSAKNAIRAMADAATSTPAASPGAIAETAAKKGRVGTVLDRYA